MGPALRLFLWSRAAIWVIAATTALAFDSHLNPERRRWDSPRLHDLGVAIDVWARWDSDWFLRIAEHGYSWPSSTPAFFPLYPALVAAFGRIGGDHFVAAGVLISLALGCFAAVSLSSLAQPLLGERGAQRSVLYLAIFPTSFYLGAVYSESLFLALAVTTFVLAERGRLGWAGVIAGLALLTRAQGLALLPALALFAHQAGGGRRYLTALATPLAIFAAYPLLLLLSIDRPFAFVDAQEVVWERHLSPLGPLGGLFDAVTGLDLLELAFAIPMLALAGVAWRRFGATYGVYAFGALLLPMAYPSERLGGLYSFPRLCLVAFPVLPRARRRDGATVGPARDGRGSHDDPGRVRGSMVAMALGRLTTTTRGMLVGWAALVTALAALAYAGNFLVSDDEKRDDLLYLWSSAIAGLVQYAVVAAVLFAIARPLAPSALGLKRPASWSRALGIAFAGLVAVFVIGYVLGLFLEAGEEQGLVPDGWDSSRAAPFVANFVVVTLVAPVVEELTFRGLGFAVVRDVAGVGPAILITGLAFGLAHGLVIALPILACFGVILAVVRVRTESLYPAIILHATFNGLALIAAVTVGSSS